MKFGDERPSSSIFGAILDGMQEKVITYRTLQSVL